MREGRGIKRRCGLKEAIFSANLDGFACDEVERMNQGGLDVFGCREEGAIALRRGSSISVTSVAASIAVGMVMSFNLDAMMISGGWKLLKEMMHPMRRGKYQEE